MVYRTDDKAGCTVHFVNSGVDEGAIIGQAEINIFDGDNAEDLAKRTLVKEHLLYPICIEAVASGDAKLENGKCLLKNKMEIIKI